MSAVPSEFWAPEPLAPIPFLAELRDFVLDRSHSRLPKWRFRLADDLAVQIQPRPGERRDWGRLFDCIAIQGPDMAAVHFASDRERRAQGLWRLVFGIAPTGDAWSIKIRQLGWHNKDMATSWALRSRLLAEMRSGRFDGLTASMMLRPSCLVCGKGLTDPASVARWIGPECWGNGSLSVPHVLRVPDLLDGARS